MTELLQSLKSDLLSRRLLPFVGLLAVVLVAAVVYAVTGGSSGASPAPVAQSAPNRGVAPTLPVVVAPANPHQAVSETPAGSRYQSQGPTRDPFVPLPSPAAQSASTGKSSSSAGKSKSSSSAGSSSGKTGSTGGSSSEGEKAPAPAPKKKSTKPAQSPYVVAILFGRASTTPAQPVTLTPYESLKPLQPLPSKQEMLIAFERVTVSGSGAVFKLVVPPILHRSGICLPSTSECEAIDLEVGHAEELEYVDTSGRVVVYELKVVSITKKNAAAARVKHQAKTARMQTKPRAAQAIGDASTVRGLASHS